MKRTLTNLQTLSFAIVMVAMLMVGTIAPMHQVAAQEASFDERTAMLEQISLLMEMIANLQEQLLVKERKQFQDMHQSDTNVIHGNSYVIATKRITLYKAPDGQSSVGKQSDADGGDVIDGPRLIEGQIWWKVEFEENEGWVNENYLERVPSISINHDLDGDGVKERVARILGDYRADRFILFPRKNEVIPVYVDEGMEMIGTHENAYTSGQVSKIVDGPVAILQSNPYDSSKPFIKGQHTSVPIAWQAVNVPMNAEVEVQVEAVRLVDSSLSGGTWQSDALVGDSVSRYFWSIEGIGRIGAGDYRTQVRIIDCNQNDDCEILAESEYRYFTIVNQE
jgi:hypothetical protein